MRTIQALCIPFVVLICGAANVAAQTPRAVGQTVMSGTTAAATPVLPPGYVIGPADVLSIVFWRDKDMTADVTVRPDGKITLPLLNEVTAGGYTPEELRVRLVEAAKAYIEDPNATVVVKEIRSRNVFITGSVAKPAVNMSADNASMHKDMANAIRALAMDAVEQAKSGHPGMPMGMADVATVLFTQFLKFDASAGRTAIGSCCRPGTARCCSTRCCI